MRDYKTTYCTSIRAAPELFDINAITVDEGASSSNNNNESSNYLNSLIKTSLEIGKGILFGIRIFVFMYSLISNKE